MIVGFPVISSLTVDEEIIKARQIWEKSTAHKSSSKLYVKCLSKPLL